MRKIKIKRPKWRKPPSSSNGCRAGDRLTVTTHNGDRVVEVVEVYDGRIRVREVSP